MAALFGRDVKTMGKHIANARREELNAVPTVAKFATVQHEGDRLVTRQVEHDDLDMIVSVGYRVKSSEGVRLRQWSNQVLRQYVMKGAALNEQRLQHISQVPGQGRRAEIEAVPEGLVRITMIRRTGSLSVGTEVLYSACAHVLSILGYAGGEEEYGREPSSLCALWE